MNLSSITQQLLKKNNVLLSVLIASSLSLTGCGGGTEAETSPAVEVVDNAPSNEDPVEESSENNEIVDVEPELEEAPVSESVQLPVASSTTASQIPDELRLSSHYDSSNPSVAITPTLATASGGNAEHPERAIDGSATTRYESTHGDDNAWIQFDFGSKTEIGYMKLIWERAHADEYIIQVSDDAENWYQLRYVMNSDGGTEEFFNLNIDVQYIRIQGVQRSSNYGYSLFEAEFKTPGSDNTQGNLSTSFTPFPLTGELSQPLASPEEPIEIVRFSLPDGTLVTRFGVVGRSRHARERGEEWNEIGFGDNETVEADGVTPHDNGPGAHLNFVKNYFKNRTWGMEIIDNSLVEGVTRPTLKINEYFQQAQFAGGSAFFRGFSNPRTTGFGWMSPGKLVDDSLYGTNHADCPIVPKPPNGALLNPIVEGDPLSGTNNGCSLTISSYPSYSALSYNQYGVLVRSRDVEGATEFWDFRDKGGVLVSNTNISSSPLRIGDAIEATPSFFTSDEAMIEADPIGEDGTGGHRYYTNEWTYVVGEGLRPWYGRFPRLTNEPLPDEVLQGGLGSVSYDYADNSEFVFQQPHNNIGMQNMQRFVEGRRWIHTNMWTGEHNEDGNDLNEAGVGLQGPHFNQSSCFGCHVNNGRGVAPIQVNQQLDMMAVFTATTETDNTGQQRPHPVYGQGVQMNARSSDGVAQDWGNSVRVGGFETHEETLADGTVVELSKPVYAFDGVTPEVFTVRTAQPLLGMGLLEAISEEEILSRVRTSPDQDGVMGKANYAYDPETGEVHIGRYGWKASKVSLRHQSASAALLDMSVTNPVYPNRNCLTGPAQCDSAYGVEDGLSEDELNSIVEYLSLLAVPAQRKIESGFPNGVTPLAALDVDPIKIDAGEQIFKDIRCSSCHVTDITTGTATPFDENRNQKIKPYTDMLLHDMGSDLADNFVEGQATGSMWRTPALWGIGYTEGVAGNLQVGYLHDSRARTLTEAIMWHGGEGEASKNRFANLSTDDREALLTFLKSL